MKIDDQRACLFDSENMQPTFLSLRFCLAQLHLKSVNYQISTLTNIMYFHEYWLAKFSCTLDYSMYKGEFSGSVISTMISELEGFWLYLSNARTYVGDIVVLPLTLKQDPIQKIQTNVSRYQTVCRFISWLIDTYITPYFISESIEDVDKHKKSLHSFLKVENKKFQKYSSNQRQHTSLYKSLTQDQLRDFVSLFALPKQIIKDEDGKLLPSLYVAFRNIILVKLLTQYGLRVGEALLLRGTSFKSNMAGTIFYMYVANLRDGIDPRKHKPLIKTSQSIRELKITSQDYKIIKMFMKQVELRASHNFLLTSSIGDCPPLSYKSAYKIIRAASDEMKEKYPEHFNKNHSEYLYSVHPHMLRHTWAYIQLGNLYHHFEERYIKAGVINTMGVMESAKDSLRQLGGWSDGSMMPSNYAKRFIAEQANEVSIKIFKGNAFDLLESKQFPEL